MFESSVKALHIVYLITRADELGGAQVHVLDLARCFLKRGVRVTVLAGGNGPVAAALREAGIPYMQVPHLVRPIRPWDDVRCFLELRRFFRMLEPDLVSVHSSKAGWLGRLAAYSLGIPVIFTVHGWAFTEGIPHGKRLFYAWAERIAASFCNRIITVSEYDRLLALRKHIAPAARLVTIHNGVSDIPEALLARPGEAVEPVRLVMVARFSPQKAHALLLEALAGLQELPWELELIGDGPLLPRCKRLAEQLGLAGRVRFLGERRDVAERLARAHLFVLASNYEGFPLSILEAMRAQLPVIASNVGGVCEAVIDGKTGRLVDRGNVRQLREALYELITRPMLREQWGRAGRQRFIAHFTVDQMIAKTWQVYEEVIGFKKG